MRINKVNEFISRVVMRTFILISVVAVFLLTPRVIATGEALAAPTCEAGSHQMAGQCAPDPAPAAPLASSLDYATESVIVPEGQNPDTMPVTKVHTLDGAEIWIPEEDPSGGHPTQARMWLDNSPLYSGGWLLQVNDVTGSVQWIDVQERLTLDDEATPATAQTAVQTVAFTSTRKHHQPAEDSPRFNCARHGNHVCGPRYPHDPRAGCYRHGRLVVKWTRYDLDQYGNPSHDPLWAQVYPPC